MGKVCPMMGIPSPGDPADSRISPSDQESLRAGDKDERESELREIRLQAALVLRAATTLLVGDGSRLGCVSDPHRQPADGSCLAE